MGSPVDTPYIALMVSFVKVSLSGTTTFKVLLPRVLPSATSMTSTLPVFTAVNTPSEVTLPIAGSLTFHTAFSGISAALPDVLTPTAVRLTLLPTVR